MTERLYYKNPALLEFDASIIQCHKLDDKYATVLDQSAFYPTSGGQPHDTGMINAIPVIDVTEDDAGVINHITSEPTGKSNDKVKGVIDFDRRKYFRQLHTAQHILSRAFINLFNAETVSVHLGEEYGAVELNIPSVTAEQSEQAEQLSNQIITNNDAVEIIFADAKQASLLPIRKKVEREGVIRIIKIGELDWSACGGTHCLCTAEVGILKVIGIEKQRGHALIKFLAGTKAKQDYDSRFNVTDKLTKDLTCSLIDLPSRLNKLTDENKDLRHRLFDLQLQLLPAKIEALAQSATKIGKFNFICSAITDLDPKQLNLLAGDLANKINGAAALLLDNRLCIATPANSTLDAGAMVKQLSAKFSLKGGGSKNLAQLGGVDSNKLDDYKKELMAIINAM
jgi:alanyl-tRNA synthetase